MLDKLKLMLGLTDTTKDNLLKLLIDQATAEAVAYTHNKKEGELDTAILMMCVYKYNRMGTEGLSAESYSGDTFNYEADYPDTIKRLLDSKRYMVIV